MIMKVLCRLVSHMSHTYHEKTRLTSIFAEYTAVRSYTTGNPNALGTTEITKKLNNYN